MRLFDLVLQTDLSNVVLYNNDGDILCYTFYSPNAINFLSDLKVIAVQRVQNKVKYIYLDTPYRLSVCPNGRMSLYAPFKPKAPFCV